MNACTSADLAEPFAEVADVVVAHDGPLDDDCAVVFAGKLYEALRDVPSVAEAAVIAAGNAVLDDDSCQSLRENLVVRRQDSSVVLPRILRRPGEQASSPNRIAVPFMQFRGEREFAAELGF